MCIGCEPGDAFFELGSYIGNLNTMTLTKTIPEFAKTFMAGYRRILRTNYHTEPKIIISTREKETTFRKAT